MKLMLGKLLLWSPGLPCSLGWLGHQEKAQTAWSQAQTALGQETVGEDSS